MILKVDIILVSEMGHFVVEFEGFNGHEELRYDVRIGTVSRKHEEFHDELDFLEGLEDFVGVFKLRHFNLSDIKQLHGILLLTILAL